MQRAPALDDVKEVAAEDLAPVAGAVGADDRDPRVVDERVRYQAALHARVLGALDAEYRELALEALGELALDRMADSARETRAADRALDQVVLRAGAERLDPTLLVGIAGQHDDRHLGIRLSEPADGFDPERVGESEVEQDAVGRTEPALGLAKLSGAVDPQDRPGLDQQLGHDRRVAVIVLDQQHAARLDASGGLHHPTPTRVWQI